jgi:hypothetical protein
MTHMSLCGIPVERNDAAPADKIVLHPAQAEIIEARILDDAEIIEARILDDAASFRALKHLYHAILEMSESGIGYSPKTSDAMKKLKQIPSLQP